MPDKVFKTYKEQRLLLESRGLAIKSPTKFYTAMKQDDYYNVINGYKKFFIATFSPEVYIAGTTFNHIYALYSFDQELRRIILPELLAIEKNIKSILAYQFSSVYGYDHNQYLVSANFKYDQRNIKHTQNTIFKIQKTLNYFLKHDHAAIVHYITKYGYVPLWVLNSVLTFGEVVHFYDCLKLTDQQNIAACFKMPASTLNGFLFALDDYRNICAHGSRLYTSNRSTGPLHRIPNTIYHQQLNIPMDKQGNYKHARSDVMSLLIALKTFSTKAKFKKIAKAFISAEKKLSKALPLTIMQNIDNEMGLPSKYLPILLGL